MENEIFCQKLSDSGFALTSKIFSKIKNIDIENFHIPENNSDSKRFVNYFDKIEKTHFLDYKDIANINLIGRISQDENHNDSHFVIDQSGKIYAINPIETISSYKNSRLLNVINKIGIKDYGIYHAENSQALAINITLLLNKVSIISNSQNQSLKTLIEKIKAEGVKIDNIIQNFHNCDDLFIENEYLQNFNIFPQKLPPNSHKILANIFKDPHQYSIEDIYDISDLLTQAGYKIFTYKEVRSFINDAIHCLCNYIKNTDKNIFIGQKIYTDAISNLVKNSSFNYILNSFTTSHKVNDILAVFNNIEFLNIINQMKFSSQVQEYIDNIQDVNLNKKYITEIFLNELN